MNVFYNQKCDLVFSDFGIEIPIVNDRALNVFNKIKEINQHLQEVNVDLIPKITKEDLYLVHTKEYIDSLFSSAHELEYQILKTFELVDESGNYHRYNPNKAKENLGFAFKVILSQVGLTYFSSKEALKSGFSYYLGGGMHHSMTNTGRGFCLLNDIAITIRKLQQDNLIKRVWVIDVDAHKGDGTAEIFKGDLFVQTFSIHMKEGWPLNSGSVRDPWFIPSTIDVGVDVNEEERYLDKLEMGLLELSSKYPRADLAIVVNGADPYCEDELESSGLIKLSKEQMLKRDQLVYHFLKELNIPQSYVMAGGYGKKSWEIYYQFLKFVGESSS